MQFFADTTDRELTLQNLKRSHVRTLQHKLDNLSCSFFACLVVNLVLETKFIR